MSGKSKLTVFMRPSVETGWPGV